MAGAQATPGRIGPCQACVKLRGCPIGSIRRIKTETVQTLWRVQQGFSTAFKSAKVPFLSTATVLGHGWMLTAPEKTMTRVNTGRS
jgi:hypothetical protein